jgi:hypothetical protein
LKKKSENRYKVYSSIDTMPIWNYEKVQELADVRYVCNVDDYSEIEPQPYMYEAFDIVFTEFYDYFGISAELSEYLNMQRSMVLLELDYQLTKDGLKKTQLAQKQREFDSMYNREGMDIDKIAVVLSRWLGFDLDIKKISVKRFYNYLKEFEKHGKN